MEVENTSSIHFNSTINVLKWKYGLEGVALPMVGIFGVLGNLIVMRILWAKDIDFKSTFRNLLYSLSLYDSLCIFSNILIFTAPNISETYRHQVYPRLVPCLLPMAQIAVTGSVLTTVTVAIERAVCVQRPHFKFPHHSETILPVLVFFLACSFNLNRFFEYTFQVSQMEFPAEYNVAGATKVSVNLELNTTTWSWYSVSPTNLRLNPVYSKTSTVFSIIGLNTFPFILLVVLNMFIYRGIKNRTFLLPNSNAREKRDLHIASILVLIVLLFVVCHSPSCYINLLEFVSIIRGEDVSKSWPPEMNVLVAASHLLITINSSSNFLIYFYKDIRFRQMCLMYLKLSCFQKQLLYGGEEVEPAGARESLRQTLLTTLSTRRPPHILERRSGAVPNNSDRTPESDEKSEEGKTGACRGPQEAAPATSCCSSATSLNTEAETVVGQRPGQDRSQEIRIGGVGRSTRTTDTKSSLFRKKWFRRNCSLKQKRLLQLKERDSNAEEESYV